MFYISEFPLDGLMTLDYKKCIPSHSEGRLAIVTDAGRDAVDVDGPLTNGTETDGESAWS